ncbi:MAG: hypothetical protein IJX80_07440, partial [Clostridia bacterium]|nr:hypothetical protein [Clostridia bacterium]
MKMHFDSDTHGVLKSLDIILDFLLNFTIAYVSAIVIRWFLPAIEPALMFLIIVAFCIAASMLYNYHNVYLPMRIQTPLFFIGRIFLVNIEIFVVAVLLILITRVEPARFYLIWLMSFSSVSFLILA